MSASSDHLLIKLIRVYLCALGSCGHVAYGSVVVPTAELRIINGVNPFTRE